MGISDEAEKIRKAMNWTEAEAVSFMNSLERVEDGEM